MSIAESPENASGSDAVRVSELQPSDNLKLNFWTRPLGGDARIKQAGAREGPWRKFEWGRSHKASGSTKRDAY